MPDIGVVDISSGTGVFGCLCAVLAIPGSTHRATSAGIIGGLVEPGRAGASDSIEVGVLWAAGNGLVGQLAGVSVQFVSFVTDTGH